MSTSERMKALEGGSIGKYPIRSLLAVGGMAAVYLAWHPDLEQDIILKVLLPVYAQDRRVVERFQREARDASRLNHPNIIRVFDAGEANGHYYIAMQYVRGGTLMDRLEQQGGKPIDIVSALSIITQVASALDYAHYYGVIHRDVKPSNILLSPEGHAILSDFGIAFAVERTWLTTDMMVLGTPSYMSPEQGRGERVDGRSDIYALGAVLYEMLSGRAPYQADTPWALVHKHIYEPLPPLRRFNPAVPAAVEQVLNQALAKDPDQRYQTAGAMARALALATQGRSVPKAGAKRPARPLLWIGVVAGALVLLAIGSLAVRELVPLPTLVPTAELSPWATVTAQAAATAVALGAERATATAVMASERALVTIQAEETQHALDAVWATVTAQAEATSQMLAARDITATAQAGATAAALATEHARETARAQATQQARATSTARALKTAEAQARFATSTTQARQTASANAKAAEDAKTATAVAISRQRPGVVADFETNLVWSRGDQPYGELARSTEQVKAGSYAGQLRYDFPAVADNYVVFGARPSISIGGRPTGIQAWAYGDGSGHFLNAWIIDAAKEVRSYTFGRIQYNGWQLVTAWFDEQRGWPNGHISGPDNGQLDFPVRLYALVLDGVPDGQPSSGVVYLDELTATDQAIPESTPAPPRGGTRGAQLPGPPAVGQTVGIGALLGCGLLLGVMLVTDWPEHLQGRIKRLVSSYRIPSRRRPGPLGPTGGPGCAC